MSDFFSLRWDESAPQLTISVDNDYSTECLLINLSCSETMRHDLTHLNITSDGNIITYSHEYVNNKLIITVEKDIIDCSDLTISGYVVDIAGNNSNTINSTINMVCANRLFKTEITGEEPIYSASLIDGSERGDIHSHDYYKKTEN